MDQQEDVGLGVGSADPEVMQAAVDPQGDGAGLVDVRFPPGDGHQGVAWQALDPTVETTGHWG